MSNRTPRREAERTARKLAYKQLRHQQTQPVESAEPIVAATPTPTSEIAGENETLLARVHAFFTPNISEAQLAANQANAKLSTGARTAAGKAKSSMNALKHGLTSQTVVLAGEDAAEYHRQLESSIERFKPVGHEETRLVQSMLDSHWRLDRLLRCESAIFLKGDIEFEGKFEDRARDERTALSLCEIYLKYEKPLRNLHMQEARLRRCREKDLAELSRLQTLRKREEQIASEAPTTAVSTATQTKSADDANGFVFSTDKNPLFNSLSRAA